MDATTASNDVSGEDWAVRVRTLTPAERATRLEAVEQARRGATANVSAADILAAIDEGRAGR